MTLARVLQSIGQPLGFLSFPDGSRLLLLPHGARVLGLYAADDEQNFFWTHPELAAAKTARTFFRSEGWHNSGGDRSWIAPEIELFFPELPKLDVYRVPPQLDPGRYQAASPGASAYSCFCTLGASRTGESIRLQIRKGWTAALNPLRRDSTWNRLKNVQYAGYTQKTTLRLMSHTAPLTVSVGIWNLLQLPPGGDFLVPTTSRTQPTVYFGTIPRGHLKVQRHSVRYSMKAPGIQKIGIRAIAATGRAGYLCEHDGRWALVVRNFFVDPSGEYVDVPWEQDGQLGERGFAVQACNVNSDLGQFSEMEYHAPAVGGNTGYSYREDASQVWAYRGSRDSLEFIAQHLLGL